MKNLLNQHVVENLIKNIPSNKNNIPIAGIASNSNEIRKNYIFLQLKEKRGNGEKYIKDAITKGASIIVCSKKCKFKDRNIFVIKKK